jgi:hypothetical protein
MRYTLRLLTLQQFQRASALVCACEALRREAAQSGDLRWGREPFRIGLWVGQRATPNWTDQSDEAIKQDHGQYQQGSSVGGSGSPHQLTNCPWCGTAIDPGKNIRVHKYPGREARTFVYCGDALGRCLFSERQAPAEGLPVLVVDEEIYRRLPAMLIATVDKFAQLPWQGATQMLFGQVSSHCPRHGFRSPSIDDADNHPKSGRMPAVKSAEHPPLRPPDLVIQDELHLISGPLGTLVGLYETAVERLCSWQVDGRRVLPKVIASTATVRRAAEQVDALFTRRLAVFPPQALDVRDNFFSVQREPSDEHPGRRYLGICAPGKRIKVALIRVYVALLAASQQLYERDGGAADPWMTLVGYFNAMREQHRKTLDAPQDEAQGAPDLKLPEWQVLSRPDPARNTADFHLTVGAPPPGYERTFSKIVLAERLREVRAVVGFTRIISPGDFDEGDTQQADRRAPHSRKAPKWVPATEVHGEGIFFELREELLLDWTREALQEQREALFLESHRRWRHYRRLPEPDAGFPGIRYVLLHSFAHALMRQLSLECGYAAASIRERIYSREPEQDGGPMAGVLIYTAAPDSEGTLGGLVSLGQPEALARHLGQALEQIRLCASDPLCAEHAPSLDGLTLHAAACHACLFAPETSCERGNRYLDRAVLVRTVAGGRSALFQPENQSS